jgi:lysyl-tRNA synthetase, class II
MTDLPVPGEPVPDEGEFGVRLSKRARLLDSGTSPYPVGYPRTHTIAAVRAGHADLPPDTFTGQPVSIAGRVMLSRDGGKLCFATLRDGTGDIQVMISLDRVGAGSLAAWKRDVDLADHVGVTGRGASGVRVHGDHAHRRRAIRYRRSVAVGHRARGGVRRDGRGGHAG